MKKVFEENETAPSTNSTPKSTAKRSRKATTSSGDDLDDTQTTPTTKRKRASPKKKTAPIEDEAKVKPEPENDEEPEDLPESKPKRTKVGKNNIKVTPKPKPKPKDIVKKEETSKDGEDPFFDAQADLDHQAQVEEAVQDRKSAPFAMTSSLSHKCIENLPAEPADSLDSSDGFI
jgi:hypothetical protein